MSRAPAHAGRLRPSEQAAFALVFALMAGFIVMITMATVRSGGGTGLLGTTAAAGSQTLAAGTGGSAVQPDRPTGGRTLDSHRLDARLATALRPVLSTHHVQLAVGVIDQSTGSEAIYDPTRRFSSAGIITADILAALVTRHQMSGTHLTSGQASLAATMMRTGSGRAAAILWRAIGAGNGLTSANHMLKLSSTTPGSQWNQTTTTVTDQLRLLADLTSASSPLSRSARDYMVRLMTGSAAQRYGVLAAATEVAGSAAANGWLTTGNLWIANSIGIVRHSGQLLLVVVLSSGSSSRAAGIWIASAAARAAADVVTGQGR